MPKVTSKKMAGTHIQTLEVTPTPLAHHGSPYSSLMDIEDFANQALFKLAT